MPKTAVLSVCPLTQANDLPLVCCCSILYLWPSRRRAAVLKYNFSSNLLICVKLWGSGHLHLLLFSALTPPSLKAQTDFCSDRWGKYHIQITFLVSKCSLKQTKAIYNLKVILQLLTNQYMQFYLVQKKLNPMLLELRLYLLWIS